MVSKYKINSSYFAYPSYLSSTKSYILHSRFRNLCCNVKRKLCLTNLSLLANWLNLFIWTDSTSSHEFASRFGLAMFLYAKNTQKLSQRPSPAQVFVECAGHGRSIASDNMSGNNSDHSGERLSQNGDNESLYLHDLKNVV